MIAKLRSALPGLGFWLLLMAIYGLYLPGQQGALHFDDEINLRGLSQVQTGGSALIFVTSGEAGDLSRPIALASFLLNIGDWPQNPPGFLYINILIHLLNGALLAWLVLRLIRLIRPELAQRTEWIAFSTAGLWLLSPLLVSTSLIIIQRMASLCATFMLAGLLTYLIGLSWEAAGRVIKGRCLQAVGIGLGTLLAVLSKENGVLLSLYALILEVTVLAGVGALAAWRRWRMILLALPPLALLIYIADRLSPAAFAARDFTLTERLLTQPIILWDYLRLALLPQTFAFTPFHDDYPIAHGLLDPPIALLAIAAWLIVFVWAVWQRRRWPWFALAVFWYLGGHALESSVLPLELYFEHRNYMPLIGSMMALAWLAWTATGTWRRIAPALLAAYALMLAVVLWQTTSLWGQQLLAGEIWAIHHPASPRAQQFLAQRYVLIGEQNTAYKVLSHAARDNPARIDLAIQALQLACDAGRETEVNEDYARAASRLATGVFGNAALSALSILIDLREQQRCASLSNQDMHRMLDALLNNPRYQAAHARHHLHHMKARLYRQEKDLDRTVHHLDAAFRAKPEIGTALITIGTFLSAGLHQEALTYLTTVRQQAPANPVLRSQWMTLLDQLEEQIPSLTPSPAP